MVASPGGHGVRRRRKAGSETSVTLWLHCNVNGTDWSERRLRRGWA